MCRQKSSTSSICLISVLLALTFTTVGAIGTVKPKMFDPVSVSAQIKFTGVDGITDPTANDRLYAVGVYQTAASPTTNWSAVLAKYDTAAVPPKFFLEKLIRIPGQNEPVLGPGIFVREKFKFVWWMQDSTTMWMFDSNDENGTNCNTWDITKVILPSSYTNYSFGYVKEWFGIVKKVAAAQFWFAKFKSGHGQNSGARTFCHIKQAVPSAQTTCSSCGVSGDDNNNFLIAGKYDNKLQILIVQRDKCIADDTAFTLDNIQVTLPAPYTTADWYFSKADKKDARTAIAAITRKLSSTTNVLLFYTKKSGANTYPIKQLKYVTLANNIVHEKVQVDSNDEAMFMFLLSDGKIVMFWMDTSASKFHTFDFPAVNSPTSFAYHDFTYYKNDAAHAGFVVGEAISFRGMNVATLTATDSTLSGFVMGLDNVNSCVFYTDTWAPTIQDPAVYDTPTFATDLVNSVAGWSVSTETTTIASGDAQNKNSINNSCQVTLGTDFIESQLACSSPIITAPTISPIYYIIHSSNTATDYTYTQFTFGPSIFSSTWSFTNWELLTPPASGVTLDHTTPKLVIQTADTSLSGTYTMTIRYTCSMTSDTTNFTNDPVATVKAYLIKVVTQTVANMEHSKSFTTDTTATNTKWSISPSTGDNMPSYSLEYKLFASDETTAAPAWLTIDTSAASTFAITINKATAVVGTYNNMVVRAEVKDHTGTGTGKYFTEKFNVVVYELLSTPVDDVVYVVDASNTLESITFGAFTCPHCPASLLSTLTYSLETSGATPSDALTTYASWLKSLTQATRKVEFQSSDTSLAGQYTLVLKGSISSSPATTATTSFKVTLIALQAPTQADITYLFKDSPPPAKAIVPFTYTASGATFAAGPTWTYSLVHTSGPTNVATLDASSNVLVGDVTSITAGSVSGAITDVTKKGLTTTFTLTGQLSGAVSGQVSGAAGSIAIPARAKASTTFKVHIVDFDLTTNDLAIMVGQPQETKSFTITYLPAVAGLITSYTCSLKQDTGSGYTAPPTYSGVTIDSPGKTLSVYETDTSNFGVYKFMVSCIPNVSTSFKIEKAFTVSVVSITVNVPPVTQYHLIGPLSMTYQIASNTFKLSPDGVIPAAAQVYSYSCAKSDGSSIAALTWLSCSTSGLVTISASLESQAGIFNLLVIGSLPSGTAVLTAKATLQIHNVLYYKSSTDLTGMSTYYVGGKEYYIQNSLAISSNPTGPYSQFVATTKLQKYVQSTMTSEDTVPPFISEISPTTLQIQTNDVSNIGIWTLNKLATVTDANLKCPQAVKITAYFKVFIFSMEKQPLTNQRYTIKYQPVTYTFPKFVQWPPAAADLAQFVETNKIASVPDSWMNLPAVPVTYGLRFVSSDNNVRPQLSEFIRVVDNSRVVVQTSDLALEGNYTVHLTGSFEYNNGAEKHVLEVPFNVTLVKPVRTYEEAAPKHVYFDVRNHTMGVSEGWTFAVNGDSPVWTERHDEMRISVNLGKAAAFATFNEQDKTITINKGALTAADIGQYPISVSAHFVSPLYSESFEASFTLDIVNDIKIIKEPKVKSLETWTSFKKNSAKESLTLGPIEPSQPVPYIRDLTSTGVLVIGWDREMTQRDDFALINPSRVAVANFNSTEADPYNVTRRVLNVRYFDQLENREQLPEWYLIVESLELKVRPGDLTEESRHLNLTWEMLSYSNSDIFIQLYFEHPGRVSEQPIYDTLEVYFWGTQFFTSEEGVPVRYGTRLERQIVRQVEPATGRLIEAAGKWLAALVWAVCLFSVLVSRRLLPTWMFVNSLQLITHLLLCRLQLPAEAALFLKQFAGVARFNPLPMLPLLDVTEDGGAGFSAEFVAFGYKSRHLVANLNWVMLLWIVAGALLVLALCKDVCCRLCGSREVCCKERHLPAAQNLTVRVAYETFFEGCLCALIAVATPAEYLGDNVTWISARIGPVEEATTKQNVVAASVILSTCLLFVVFALSFAWQTFACACCAIENQIERQRVTNFFSNLIEMCTLESRRRGLIFEAQLKARADRDRQLYLDSVKKGADLVPEKQKMVFGEDIDIEHLNIQSAWVKGAQPNKFIAPPTKQKPSQSPDDVMESPKVSRRAKSKKDQSLEKQLSNSLFISDDDLEEVHPKGKTAEASKSHSRNQSGQVEESKDDRLNFQPQLIRYDSFQNLEEDLEQVQPNLQQDNSAILIEAKLKNFDSFFNLMANKNSRNNQNKTATTHQGNHSSHNVTHFDQSSNQTPAKLGKSFETDIDLLEGGQEVFDMKVLRKLMQIHEAAFFRVARAAEIQAQIEHSIPGTKTLWLGLRFSSDSQFTFLYPVIFLVRRALMAALLVFGADLQLGQIVLLFYSSFFMILFLTRIRVWDEGFVQWQHMANEVVLLVVCFSIMLQTPEIDMPYERILIATCNEFIVVVVSLFIGFNLLVIVGDFVWNDCRVYFIRRDMLTKYRGKYRHALELLNKRNETMAERLEALLDFDDKHEHAKWLNAQKRKYDSTQEARLWTQTENDYTSANQYLSKTGLLPGKSKDPSKDRPIQSDANPKLETGGFKKRHRNDTLNSMEDLWEKEKSIRAADLTKLSLIQTTAVKLDQRNKD